MGQKITVQYRQNFNLKKAADTVKKPTKILRRIGDIRREDFNYIIAKGLDPSHKKVQPLSPAYRARKPTGKKIRELTGDMINSYAQKIQGDKLIESITDPKAEIHQRGTDRIPQRKMLPDSFEEMTPKVRKKILEVLAKAVIESL